MLGQIVAAEQIDQLTPRSSWVPGEHATQHDNSRAKRSQFGFSRRLWQVSPSQPNPSLEKVGNSFWLVGVAEQNEETEFRQSGEFKLRLNWNSTA
jgi:hypothetical protein